MTNKTPSAIGAMFHRFRGDIPPFEVTTFSSYYDFGTEYYAGSKVGGESYTLMANTWRFVRYPEKDDDGMNKESEIIDELIEDERHDCDAPKVMEWKAGEKPPCGVWLDCYDPDDYHIGIVMFKFIGDKYGVCTEKGSIQDEDAIEWGFYNYCLYVNPIDKAIAKIAKALAIEVIGSDAANDINFSTKNCYSRDYRNMAKSIINGDIPLTKYIGDK